MSAEIKLVLADDHDIVRAGLRALLSSETDFRIVGETNSSSELLELVARHAPHIVLLDLMMPHVSGLDLLPRLTREAPESRVVILSMHENEGYVVEAMRRGAFGYVLKASGYPVLLQAIREVAAGRRFLAPPLSEHAIAAYIAQADGGTRDPFETLTAREREVLAQVADGLTSHEIAKRLSISPRTVEIHRAHLLHKLGLNTQAALIHYALRRKLMVPQEP